VAQWAQRTRHVPELRFVQHYHDDPGYIAALAAQVGAHWVQHGRGKLLLMSFHGLPQRSLTLGDPYHCECHKSARLLAERLGLRDDEYRVTFQSRFGKAKWLQPYTLATLQQLARGGIGRIDVICPGFASDCLETLEEIDIEARDAFLDAGGSEFHYIACLNDRAEWVTALRDLSLRHLQGWDFGANARQMQGQRERALAMGAAD
jgi:ferrochelatase